MHRGCCTGTTKRIGRHQRCPGTAQRPENGVRQWCGYGPRVFLGLFEPALLLKVIQDDADKVTVLVSDVQLLRGTQFLEIALAALKLKVKVAAAREAQPVRAEGERGYPPVAAGRALEKRTFARSNTGASSPIG